MPHRGKDGAPAPPVLLALRERTSAAHRSLERALALAAPEAGRETYARHVAALWGWMQPTEAALWCGAWPSRLRVSARRRKADWLAADIAVARADGVLGSDPALGAACVASSPAARFGLAYVIEGSMLGGSVLLRRLEQRLAPWPARYLRGYGSAGGEYWRQFVSALAEQVVGAEEIAQAADAAERAFDSLAGWLRAQGVADGV